MAEEGAPVQLEAAVRLAPERVAAEAPPKRPAAAAAPQKVSWTADYPELASLPASKPKAGSAAPEPLNLIRRYRDSKGVIHISNVEPEAADPLPAPRRPAPTPVEAVAPAAVRPAAWSGAEAQSPLKLRKTAAVRQAVTTEGGIKRWRDKKGVWHIETVEYPLPPGVMLPPRLGGPGPGRQAAATPVTFGSPSAPPRSPPTAVPAPAASSDAKRVPTITAYKDGRGRLKITNDAPVNLAKPPPARTAVAPAELEPLITEAAQVHRLPATLIRAVIKSESNFCSWAVSPKGAMGLMQLMPGTAAFLGVSEPFNPRENIHGGCRYLRMLIDFFGGNLPLALAAYNAGYQRVVDCGFQVPPIKETQDFVTTVMERYVAEELRAGRPWT